MLAQHLIASIPCAARKTEPKGEARAWLRRFAESHCTADHSARRPDGIERFAIENARIRGASPRMGGSVKSSFCNDSSGFGLKAPKLEMGALVSSSAKLSTLVFVPIPVSDVADKDVQDVWGSALMASASFAALDRNH